jgi:hypothetical protein
VGNARQLSSDTSAGKTEKTKATADYINLLEYIMLLIAAIY